MTEKYVIKYIFNYYYNININNKQTYYIAYKTLYAVLTIYQI